MTTPKGARWFSLRQELAPRRRALLFFFAFALPLLLWSAISYVPFLWHPLIEVTNAGDETVTGEYDYVATGMLVEKDLFAARNAELAAACKAAAQGTPRNPI